MLEQLLDILICPACLPEEHPLSAKVTKIRGEDILEGDLLCPTCGASYPIRQGLADLIPPGAPVPPAQARYDEWRVVASYLWSHYADLWEDQQSSAAYARWADFLPDHHAKQDTASGSRPGLDTGCAVGRFTFELAARYGFAIGVDLSRTFIATARNLAWQGRLAFEAPEEGLLRTHFAAELPLDLLENSVEFVTADVQALPFRASSFAAVASLNIVDKLPRPLDHLRQCQRVCAAPGNLLCSDPFSWSEEIVPPEAWLGGTETVGTALENIPRLLGQVPGWRAKEGEPVWWTIRDHANRYERIRSQVVIAERNP
jgi:SAM-dependent methyltransferase/uncharacterized protein YbaR (Trm112 family)